MVIEELSIEDVNCILSKEKPLYKTFQKRLCFAIIKRIYRRTKLGYQFGAIKVCKERETIIDGNHRYIAYLLAGVNIDFIPGTSSKSDLEIEYLEVYFEEIEYWDLNHPKTLKYINDDFLLSM